MVPRYVGNWLMDQFLQRVSGRDQRPIDRFWRVWVKPPSMVSIKMGCEERYTYSHSV